MFSLDYLLFNNIYNKNVMKKQIKKTFEEIYGVDRAKEIKEKAKKTRIKRGCVGIGSTKEKENERRKKISIALKKNPNGGGMRIGSGRGKKGGIKDIGVIAAMN